MLKIENTEVLGWEHAIRGMRNPLNSWAKSDSGSCVSTQAVEEGWFEVGPNDLDLMKRLRNAGTDHRKFMRMITVYVDMIGPLYWWKEFDTYKVGTVANTLSMDEFQKEMVGIYSTCVVPDTLDESPMAYKSMDEIVSQIRPTAEIVERIRPVYNFKASD